MKQKTSKPEQLASPVLARYGFVPYQDQFFPVTFYEPDGLPFQAKPDFYHPELGIYIEVKDSHLNGRKTQATARTAKRHVQSWRGKLSFGYYDEIQNDWNHSAMKQAIVQHTLTPAHFMIVFTGTPDEDTMKRIVKNGIHAYSLDRFSWFMLRWRLGQYS